MIGPYVNQIGQALSNAAQQLASSQTGKYWISKAFQELIKRKKY